MDHIELMDTDFFTDLQSWLQHVAAQQGVDVDHAAWDAWLGNRVVSVPTGSRIGSCSTGCS